MFVGKGNTGRSDSMCHHDLVRNGFSLKNAAKCDKWYQLQNHSITESLNAESLEPESPIVSLVTNYAIGDAEWARSQTE
jgi:hypothetical protein